VTRASLIALLLVVGCERTIERLDFERMRDQARLDPFDADPTFPDGRTMRRAPRGTVPHGAPIRPHDDETLLEIPVPIDRALLERGRDRFERFCAACHGVLGTGNTAVVENARLRPPPSLHGADIRGQAPGSLFRTITLGFGLMPSYALQLEPIDRWATIAYLRVLWRSQAVELATLPTDLQARARAELGEVSR
jgi:mono/diheme cytochrome c family protein